jgi:CRISPR-associated endoribonuclease Cas6
MKILLDFATKHSKLPIDYRRTILSFFKKSLSSVADGKYFEKYYVKNERRPFTFAVCLPKPEFSSEEIKLRNNNFKVVFSTGDNLAGFVFMSAFIAMKDKPFPVKFDNVITLKSISRQKEDEVSGNFAMIKMLSPLCLREHRSEDNKDIYYSVKSENFTEKFKDIVSEQLTTEGFSKELAQGVEIISLNSKKTVVKHYGNSIECSLGEFSINADKSVINYFLKYGIGSRKSAGFGFPQLVAEI